MNDDFEPYEEEDDVSLEDLKDDIENLKDKADDFRNKKKNNSNNNNNASQTEEAKNFAKEQNAKNQARTQNPELAQQTSNAATVGTGTAATTGAEATAVGASSAASAEATAAATTGAEATAAGAAVAGAAAGGGALVAVDAIPVVGQILLIVEAAIAVLVTGFKLQKKHDKKMAENGVDTKGIRRLILASPVLAIFAIILLIIMLLILLIQTETYDKAEFMEKAITCFESSTSCVDFMNTGVTIPASSRPLVKASDAQIAAFVINYVRAEGKYFDTPGATIMNIVEDINEDYTIYLDDGNAIEKFMKRQGQQFQELVEDSIIGDINYAWHLFKWLKMQRKIFNNIDWKVAYTKSTNSYSKYLNEAKVWLNTKIDGEPKIGGDTMIREAFAVKYFHAPGTNSFWLSYPNVLNGEKLNEVINLVDGYIPSPMELYATYVSTGSYELTNKIYDYYTSDDYELEVTLYELTTVVSKKKVEGDTTTTYTITRDGVTEKISKSEFEEARKKGKQGILSWLGDQINNFLIEVDKILNEIAEKIKEILGYYLTVETDYVPVVTKGKAFNYIVDQSYNIKTETSVEKVTGEEPKKQDKTYSNFKYTETKNKTQTSTTKRNVYVETAGGLYVKNIARENSYSKISHSPIAELTYYTLESTRYKQSSKGLYVRDITGSYIKVRNSSSETVKRYEYKTVDETTSTTTTETTTKYANLKISNIVNIDYEITTWTNKLQYSAANITEYEENNRYAQIFVDMVEEYDLKYTLDDVAIGLEVIEYYYSEEYVATGESIDYSALPEGEFGWPVPDNFNVAYLFGYTPAYGSKHLGIDIWPGGGSEKTNIVSVRAGTVTYVQDIGAPDNGDTGLCGDSGWNSYGNVVEIEHGDGYKTRYAHLSTGTIASNIKVGAQVQAGQYIGKMGSSGCSTGTHLHYEILFDKVRIDPLSQYVVQPLNYNVPYANRNNSAITMTQPYKVVFDI